VLVGGEVKVGGALTGVEDGPDSGFTGSRVSVGSGRVEDASTFTPVG
jgi:hypothetical protein